MDVPAGQAVASQFAADRRLREPENKVSGVKGKILIVEDDDATRDEVAELVAHEGFEAVAVRDGRGALEVLRNSSELPKAILLDMMLPEVNGWEFLKTKKSDALLAPIPVIVFTAGYTAPFDVAHVIVKPVSTSKLRLAFQTVLGVKYETA